MRVKNVIAVWLFAAFGLMALASRGQAVEQSPTRSTITAAEKILEDRQHAARQEIAERWTTRLYAALDQTLKSVAAQTAQNPGQTAQNPGKSGAMAAAEARPENRLQVAPALPAAPAMADLSDPRQDANRFIAGQPTLEQTIASARAEQAARNSTGVGAEALDDPQPGARLPMAQRTKSGLAQGGKEEADRIIADLDKSLQDYAVAAAAERARIAQKETAGQPKSDVSPSQDPLSDERQRNASEGAAQKTTVELGQGAGEEESDRIVATLDKTLQADAALQRDKAAQSEAKSQATATVPATNPAARARQREEANRIVADLNETLQARAAAERRLLAETDAKNREAAAAKAADAKVRAQQREEARRIVADLDRALHAAAAKKPDRIAGPEATSQAKTQRIADKTKKVKRVAVGKAESKTENVLHAARLDDAQPTPESTSDPRVPGVPSDAPNQLPPDAPAQQAPLSPAAGVDAPNQAAAPGELSADPQSNQGYGGRAPRAARSGGSSVASTNGPDRSLRRLCPSILANAGEYEDRLVALCRTWADGH
jgi:trimeric autotransporter adhesin